MGENDSGRVEARLTLVGRGSATTPERIAELQQQAEVVARSRAKPSQPFSQVMNKREQTAEKPPTKPMSKKDAKTGKLPVKPPKGPVLKG